MKIEEYIKLFEDLPQGMSFSCRRCPEDSFWGRGWFIEIGSTTNKRGAYWLLRPDTLEHTTPEIVLMNKEAAIKIIQLSEDRMTFEKYVEIVEANLPEDMSILWRCGEREETWVVELGLKGEYPVTSSVVEQSWLDFTWEEQIVEQILKPIVIAIRGYHNV